jgi:hypothetical protein
MSKGNKPTLEIIRNMTDQELQYTMNSWYDEKVALIAEYGKMCRVTGDVGREIAERKCVKEIDGYVRID